MRQDSSESLSSPANPGVVMIQQQQASTNCTTVAADTTTMSNQSRPSDLASLAMQLQAPPAGFNESSNLSSAGSISGGEPDTPDKPVAFGVSSAVPKSPVLLSAPPSKPVTADKRRKRKRADTTEGGSTPTERTPKAERKITEYIRVSCEENQ